MILDRTYIVVVPLTPCKKIPHKSVHQQRQNNPKQPEEKRHCGQQQDDGKKNGSESPSRCPTDPLREVTIV